MATGCNVEVVKVAKGKGGGRRSQRSLYECRQFTVPAQLFDLPPRLHSFSLAADGRRDPYRPLVTVLLGQSGV